MLELALLVVVLLPAAVHGESPDNSLESGVKLCGREFIRTVVMSCGGSRWKRYSPEPGRGSSNPYRELLDWLNSDHFFLLPDHLNSIPDGEREGQDPTGAAAPLGGAKLDNLLGPQEGPMHEEENGQLMAAPSRSKRSTGPAGSCCRRGCTKSELVRFC
ncbi:insulin-like 3 [Lissotriton helveticus]